MTIEKKYETEEEFLKNYKPGDYERPSVTVDMLLFTTETVENEDIKRVDKEELKILLIKRAGFPYKNCWALPGGFVDMNESLDEAVARELKEETNIDNVYMEQLYTFGDVKRDPRMRVISPAYMALVDSKDLKIKAGDDAKDVEWFTVSKKLIKKTDSVIYWGLTLKARDIEMEYLVRDEVVRKGRINVVETVSIEHVSGDKIAFDHFKIINLGMDRLKNKVEYTPIIFNLLPEKFTLTQLRHLYEILIGEKYDEKNFKRKISQKVGVYMKELDEKQTGKGFKPAKLYKYNGETGNI